MSKRINQKKIGLTWLHVYLLFCGVYAFVAGFLGLSGVVAWKFVAISLFLLIPIIGSWFGIRKTKALWQFVMVGILCCLISYGFSIVCGDSVLKEMAQEIEILLKTQNNERINGAMSLESIRQLVKVLNLGSGATIFLIHGYARVKKGQLKKLALEMPTGVMPPSEMELWEIPTLLDEPKPIHWVWFLIQYVLGVLIKIPFYWHAIFLFLFIDIFVCIYCNYIERMQKFIKENSKIANLPIETMQKAGIWILRTGLLVLLLILLPSVLYGKDPLANAIEDYQVKERSFEVLQLQEADAMPEMEEMDLAKIVGAKQQVKIPMWVKKLASVLMYLILLIAVFLILYGIYRNIKKAGSAFLEEEEDEILFLHKESEKRERLSKGGVKKEGLLSPNKKIRRYYKKTIQKSGNIQPKGTETPEELEEKAGLGTNFEMKRIHKYYEKARYSKDGCTKEDASQFK